MHIKQFLSLIVIIAGLQLILGCSEDESANSPEMATDGQVAGDDRPRHAKFLMDRIGHSVPTDIHLTVDEAQYVISVVGKDDAVGALISGDASGASFNYRLNSKDMNLLSRILYEDDASTGVNLEYSVDNGELLTRTLAQDDACIALLRRIVEVYRLPEYTIREGDTLSGISQMYGIEIDALHDLNPGSSIDSVIRIGQKIKVPMREAQPQAENP